MQFRLKSKFKPTGDQPQAIKKLSENIKNGEKNQVLLGVTGSGKTFTMAQVIQRAQKPVLIISPNKTLCAQLYQEFKEFFPENAVHYFVSYYDYYQPEAYIPQTDTYIEKDSKVNEEIDHLRHSAVQDLISRDDVIICASVSCIYNIGNPSDYRSVSFEINPVRKKSSKIITHWEINVFSNGVKTGQKIQRKEFIEQLTNLQYERNDIEFRPGKFRVRGEMVEVGLVTGEEILRVEFSNEKITKISLSLNGLKPAFKELKNSFRIFPSHFWATPQNKIKIAMANIRAELEERLQELKKVGKLVEAQRLEQKTNYDLEMLEQVGYCHGIENYSRHMDFREPGSAPFSLIDYFNYFHNSDFLILIDESHLTVPQIRAMSVQDRIRKQTLIDYGFRLPSAIDNRPLTFKEFEEREKKTIYMSATPSDYEKNKSGEKNIVEQIIRPTGLLEPKIEIRPAKNQIQNLISEIKIRVARKQRVLVVALTKRLAEAVSDYLSEQKIKAQWLHSEVKTLERPEILKNLRLGKYDVLVGINLLREGLDLPEVSLVAILDADKEGFLRNATTLIQTMGRAARHQNGEIIMYADKITGSMKTAITEINRRREIQEDYNKKHGITPTQIVKQIRDWEFGKKEKGVESELWLVRDKKLLEKEMKQAAKNLDFERAAEIRDLISKLSK